ncbi:MAG: glycosyltransferase family 39 protein [Phocaeicola sp.]|nr:glycosyltransferase family 39 protein [Phocaeicola sp.]
MYKKDKYAWLLAGICILSLFLFLGESLFNTRGEPREAVVALSMLEKGNWILPINNGVDMAYKPPLFHWCIAAISTITGSVSEYTSRMPSALALAMMVMAGFAFYAKRRGTEVAFLMGLITLTNFEVHRAGTNCRVDMLLSALMVIALYQLYKWGENRLKGIPLAGILCLSGAFLTKGPVGMVLPLLVVALFLLIRGMNFWKIFGSFLWVGLASCILPFLWYWAAYQQGGDEFLQLVMEENVLRFLGKMTYRSHENPAYYNVITVVAGYVPYTLLMLIALFSLKWEKPQLTPAGWWKRFKTYIREMDDTRLFSLLSIVVIFVFYCIPKSKRSVYLLPIYPFIAYFLAEYMLYLVRRKPAVLKIFGSIMGALSLLLLVVFGALKMNWIPETIFSGRHAAQNIAFMNELSNLPLGIVTGMVLVIMAGASVFFYYSAQNRPASWLPYTITGVIFTIFMALDGVFQPPVLSLKSDKPIAERIAEIVPEGRIYSYQVNIVEGNPMRPFTINFYLGDRVVPFEAFTPEKGFLLAGNDEIEQFKKQYPDYEVAEVFASGHKSCDDHKLINLYRIWK